jgi:release factor glutamine methyltransferase
MTSSGAQAPPDGPSPHNTDFPPISPGTRLAGLVPLAVAAGLDPVDARILITHALGLSRVELITRFEQPLSAEAAQTVDALLRRRLHGEPVAYLVGSREFYGLPMQVTPDVLIPRPETELLVDLALECLPKGRPGLRVLDLGTGSGAIAVAIAHTRPDISVTAVDISPAALAIAKRNANRHASEGRPLVLRQSDWYAALGDAGFNVIVSNPPYIAAGDHHLSSGDLRFEPAGALTDGADGLSDLETIVGGASAHLEPGGWLMVEHGYDQAGAVRQLLLNGQFDDVQSWQDLAGIERVSGGRWRPPV